MIKKELSSNELKKVSGGASAGHVVLVRASPPNGGPGEDGVIETRGGTIIIFSGRG